MQSRRPIKDSASKSTIIKLIFCVLTVLFFITSCFRIKYRLGQEQNHRVDFSGSCVQSWPRDSQGADFLHQSKVSIQVTWSLSSHTFSSENLHPRDTDRSAEINGDPGEAGDNSLGHRRVVSVYGPIHLVNKQKLKQVWLMYFRFKLIQSVSQKKFGLFISSLNFIWHFGVLYIHILCLGCKGG